MTHQTLSLQRKATYPEKILQIGGGNFLKGFAGWIVDILNENGLNAGIVIARPTRSELRTEWKEQEYLYTTVLRGYDTESTFHDERRVVSAVSRELSIYHDFEAFLALASSPELRFVFSNTTEAGITYAREDRFEDAPPSSFPAKMTRFLYERFSTFNGTEESGLIFLPCELIDNNGEELQKIILQYAEAWELGAAFSNWITTANIFCSTLVDRIVTGFPADEFETLSDELGYEDPFLVAGEFYHLFVIQGPESVGRELKLHNAGLNIHIVDDLKPYKERKVGILNGCHTAMTPLGLLAGIETVREAVTNPPLRAFLERLTAEEIIPCLPMPPETLTTYATSIMVRFENPAIEHFLINISLNSMAKFKARLLPQLQRYYSDYGTVPRLLSLALAALICLYRGTCNGVSFPLKDSPQFMDMYAALWSRYPVQPDAPFDTRLEEASAIANHVLSLKDHWGMDLTAQKGLQEKIATDIVAIRTKGMAATLEEYLQ